MPIFEYVCEGCKKPFELLIRSGRDKAACPRCGSARVAKQFSTYGVATKGGNPCGMPESPAPRFGGDCGKPWCQPGGGGGCAT